MGKIKTNLIYNVLYQILILIVPLITTPYVSRILLPEGVGTYSITTAIAKYFWLFAHLGMSIYGNRSIAKAKGDKKRLSETFWNLFYFQLINSSVFLILYIIYIIIWGYDSFGIVIICQIPYVLAAVLEISWFFYGTEQFKFIVIRNSIIKIITAISIFVLVKDVNDVWIYALINAISLFVGQACLWPFVKKHVNLEKPNFKIIKSHLKPNCSLFVSFVAVSIYTLMDKVMIEILSNTIELGYYENSYKIMDICCSIVGAIGAVMLPRISYLMENKKTEKVNNYLEKSMKYIMMLAIGIAFGMAGVGKEFSVIYFGKEFAASGTVMMTIAPTIIFYSWENIIKNQYLLPSNKDKIFIKATILAAITNTIINFIFIRHYGAVGAAIGTVAALFVSILYQSFKVRKELSIFKYIKNSIIFIMFASIMFVYCRFISFIIEPSIMCIFAQVFGGAIIYILLIVSYFIIIKDELILDFYTKIKSKVLK